MAIVLAEIQAAAADIHVPLEGSFAASSSVRHWAGFHPRHGKAHVWCCVQLAHTSSGGCGPIPRAFVFRQYRLRSPSPEVAFISFEIPTIAW